MPALALLATASGEASIGQNHCRANPVATVWLHDRPHGEAFDFDGATGSIQHHVRCDHIRRRLLVCRGRHRSRGRLSGRNDQPAILYHRAQLGCEGNDAQGNQNDQTHGALGARTAHSRESIERGRNSSLSLCPFMWLNWHTLTAG